MCCTNFPSFTSLGYIRMVQSSWVISFTRIGECSGARGGGGGEGDYITLVLNFENFLLARFKESQATMSVQLTRFIVLYETISSFLTL